MAVIVHTDGGARGNPGPAGIGVVIEQDGELLEEFKAHIGDATNNQAEYSALLAGLERAARHTDDTVRCVLDSELVVKQMRGEYKIKSDNIRKLQHQAKALERHFKTVSYEHTLRANNAHADRLVNEALDAAR